jgi:aspartyl/glutamyl-tRNA(Asn/Gln) amidotransferase C subunit
LLTPCLKRVEVPDAGWKREMQGLAPRYLAVLNRYAGQKVERIEFVIRQGISEARNEGHGKGCCLRRRSGQPGTHRGGANGGMVRDLNSILDYIDRLNELDTSNVEPMAQVSDRYGVDESKQGSERFAYANREDVVEGLRKSLSQEAALANAPDSGWNFLPSAEGD